jgi:hypothetical protein
MTHEPTITELAADATRAEHLISAAKVLRDTIAHPLGRPRASDLIALEAVLATAGELVASVAIELRTVADRSERQVPRGVVLKIGR